MSVGVRDCPLMSVGMYDFYTRENPAIHVNILNTVNIPNLYLQNILVEVTRVFKDVYDFRDILFDFHSSNKENTRENLVNHIYMLKQIYTKLLLLSKDYC